MATSYVDYKLADSCGVFNITWKYESFLPSDYEYAIMCGTYGKSTETQGTVSVSFNRNLAPNVFNYIRKYEGSDSAQIGELYIGELDTPQISKPFDMAVIPVYVETILE